MTIDYDKLGKCFGKILEIDRSNWDSFHEDFVLILAKFGYEDYLSVDEKKWYDDYLANGGNDLGIDDYTW